MKLPPDNMSHGTYNGRDAVSPHSDEHEHDIRAEQMRRETKENFELFRQIARDKVTQQEIASRKRRAEQEKNAYLVRKEQEYRAIREKSAAAERNDREGDRRDLTLRANQYEGLQRDQYNRDIENHDEYGYEDHDEYHHGHSRPYSYNLPSSIPDKTDKSFTRALCKMHKQQERRKNGSEYDHYR